MLPGCPPSAKGQQKNKVFKCWAIIRKAGRLLAHKVVAEVFVLRALPKWAYGFICSCNGRRNVRDLASSLRCFHILYSAGRSLIYELQIKLTTSRNLRSHPKIPSAASTENSLILNTKCAQFLFIFSFHHTSTTTVIRWVDIVDSDKWLIRSLVTHDLLLLIRLCTASDSYSK